MFPNCDTELLLRIAAPTPLSPVAIVWLLGVSQIVAYGTLYYSFAILAEDVAGSFGWPVSWLYGSLSVGLFAGGLVAPAVGRRIDKNGAGLVMAIGSVLATLALLAAGLAETGMFFAAAVVAMQVAGTLVQYDAAFAALVQLTGPDARLRITHLTLIAGFASTLFWPFTSWLHGMFGWREILFGFAAANLLLCLPIHALLAGHDRHRRSRSSPTTASLAIAEAALPEGHRRLLWLVTLGFALSGFALSAMLAQLVPILTTIGLGASALFVSTLFGPAQVLIRFINMLVGVRRHPIAATLLAVSLIPLAIAALALSAPWTLGAALFAVLLGFGSGLKSIVQGTLPLALFGPGSYGARLGFMAAVRQAMAAVAPFTLSFLIEGVGIGYALAAMVAIGVAGVVCLLEVARSRPK